MISHFRINEENLKNCVKSAVKHNVKWSAIVNACYAVFLVNSVLSLFFGTTGIIITASNRTRTQLLLENVGNLEERRLQLTAKLEALRSSPESVIIEARTLGFYRRDEGVIHIQNLKATETALDVGNALYLEPLKPSNQNPHRIIAIAAGLLVLFFIPANWNFGYDNSAR